MENVILLLNAVLLVLEIVRVVLELKRDFFPDALKHDKKNR